MLYFAMFVLRCFSNHLGWFAIDPVLSIDYIEELMKVCAVSNTLAINREVSNFFWHEMLRLFTYLTRRLGMGYLCSNIDIWDEKKKNRNFKFGKSTEKRGFYVHVSKTDRFFLANLTPPPNISPSFYRVELGDQGKPRWRPCPTNFEWKHGFCQDAAWSFSSVNSYFLDHLNVIKEGTLFWTRRLKSVWP